MNTPAAIQPWLAVQAEKIPDDIAIISEYRKLTFHRLYDEACRLASFLNDRGVSAGSHVSVISKNSESYVLLLHALLLLRAVIVPLNIRLTAEEIAEQIAFTDCGFVIVDNDVSSLSLTDDISLIGISDIFQPQNDVLYRPNDILLDESFLFMFTSGTSDTPKCVELTYQNVFYNALASKLRLRITENDSWLLSLPLYHIGGFSIIVRSVICGIPVIIPASLKSEDIMRAINDQDPSIMSLVPTMMQRLIEKGAVPNPSHRTVLLGGGPIPDNLLERCIKAGWNISPTYGATETGSQIATLYSDKPNNKNSAGQAVPFTKVQIVDQNGKDSGPSQEGEIAVKSVSLMKGYYKQEEITGQVIRNGWFFTGDYGYLDVNGNLFVKSRRSDLIVSGGENINPLEVEEVLRKHPAIRDVCVFPFTDNEWGEIVAAAVVIRYDNITSEDIKHFLSDKLALYKIPKKIFLTETLPYSEHGKLKRRKIREQFERDEP